ncbi:MAG: sodium:proton antiporter [Burkholderiaceae bacterium]
MRQPATIVLATGLAVIALPARAAGFHGASLTLAWMLPFVGILASIALLPLIGPHFWHRHFGKFALAWACAFAIPFAVAFGPAEAVHQVAHAAFAEYLPFVILLFALYTVSGGIGVLGNLHGSPGTNVGLLALGAVLANLMGTTGAAMVLVRPLIRANDNRQHKVHVLVFFIFLVGNAGGSLTPLGDPPLFLGFLKGVSFFWTTKAMLGPTLVLCGTLLAVFFALDTWLYRKAGEERPAYEDPTPDSRLRLEGKANIVLLAAIVAAVLMSGFWRPGISFDVLGTGLEIQNVVRDALLIAIAFVSLWITPKTVHEANGFNWAPMREVAKLFAAIFVTIIPAIAILKAGNDGALASLTQMVTTASGEPNNAMYFWLTGMLSAFLDNAPTYLVFFNLAGADAQYLMAHRATLEAISGGAVFMGALSYIGNAPNFMVRSIAEDRGIRMPSFFGYMLWSVPVLVPLFVVLTFLFFL